MRDLVDSPWVEITQKGRIILLPQVLFREMKERYSIKISEDRRIWVYDDGVYAVFDSQELRGFIKEHYPVEVRCFRDFDAVFKEFNSERRNVFVRDFDSREDLVAFEDGVLNVHTGEFLDHSPDFLLTRKLPCKYDKNATFEQAPVFYKFLNDLQRNDPQAIDFLLEYMGAIFSNVYGWRYKKMLLLVGSGGSGKSKLRELVVTILGKEHSLSIDLRNLVAKFGTYGLMGKRLGGSGDVASVDLDEISVLKDLTGGDDLFAEPKGKDGTSYRFDGFLFFVSNLLPFFRGDRGSHIYQRFCVIRVDDPIPEEQRDPYLLEKLLEEKDAIINICISYFIDTVRRNYRFTETECMQCERDEYQIVNNSLFTFVTSCCQRDAGKTERAVFNRIYKLWCEDNQVKPERPKDIGAEMEEQFQITATKSNTFYYPLAINNETMQEYGERASNDHRRY